MKDDQPRPVTSRRWRDWETPGAKPEPGSRRRRGLFGLLLTLMALVGAFLAWLLLVRPSPPAALLSFCITQYTDANWPVNAYAHQDGQGLLAPFQKDSQGVWEKLVHKPPRGELFDSQVGDPLVAELKKLRDHAERDQPVIVHLACLTRTGAAGQVFLLPADARPDKPDTWVKLADVLKWVEACPARNKLLILDIMRPLADPRLGVLTNDVADRVQDLLEAAKPPYFVLTACGRGQVGLVWDEMSQSVFGYYLEAGLRGAADRYGPAAQTGAVRVSGLAEFVTRRVARWTAKLGVVQTPVLWGGGAKDFIIRHVSDKPASAAEPSEPDYPSRLRQGWNLWGEWHNGPVARTAPLTFRELGAGLLRAEHRWHGGFSGDKDAKDPGHDLDLDALRQRVPHQPSRLVRRLAPSLTLLAAQGEIKADEGDVTILKDALAKIDAGDDTKKDDAKKAASKPDAEAFKILQAARKKQWKDKKARDIALAMWQVAAAEDAADPYQRAVYLNKWYQQLYSSATPYVETQFLERLTKIKPTLIPELATQIRDAFRCVREGEALLNYPSALPWIRHRLQQAEDKREQGEASLFAGTWAERQKAGPLLAQAVREFEAIGRDATIMAEAWKVRDRALDLLPGYSAYLLKRLEHNDLVTQDREPTWANAVAWTDELDRKLASPPGATAPTDAELREKLDRVRDLANQLNRALDELDAPLMADYVRDLKTQPTPYKLYELDALLELPWAQLRERPDLSDEQKKAVEKDKLDREAVWKQRRQVAGELLSKVRTHDAEDDAGNHATKAPSSFDAQELTRREHSRAVRRARLALGMLRLGGFEGVEALEKELAEVEADPTADLHPLGEKLFEAWFHKAPQQLAEQKLDKPEQRSVADRLSRILYPLTADWPWRPPDGPGSPAAVRRDQETKAYWKWLGEYYQGKSQRSKGPDKEFYQNAAEAYLR